MNIQEIWSEIDALIKARTPQFSSILNAPATETEIGTLEQHIGLTLPPSTREAYLVHDGESQSDGLFNLWEFLPLSGVKLWWDEMKRIEAEHHRGEFDSKSMIPILFSEGDLLYVTSSPDGRESPLFYWNHEDPRPDVKAESFAHFLTEFAQNFAAGKMVAEPEFELKAIIYLES